MVTLNTARVASQTLCCTVSWSSHLREKIVDGLSLLLRVSANLKPAGLWQTQATECNAAWAEEEESGEGGMAQWTCASFCGEVVFASQVHRYIVFVTVVDVSVRVDILRPVPGGKVNETLEVRCVFLGFFFWTMHVWTHVGDARIHSQFSERQASQCPRLELQNS